MNSRTVICSLSVLLLAGCVTENRKAEVIAIVHEVLPEFDRKARQQVAEAYGQQYADSVKWEWVVEESIENDCYSVKYACYDKHPMLKELAGIVVGDLASELSGGLVSVTPWSESTGVEYSMRVNVHKRSLEPIH